MSFSVSFDPTKKGLQTGQIPDIDGDGLPETVSFEIDENNHLKSGYVQLSSHTPFEEAKSLTPTSGITIQRGNFYKGYEVKGRRVASFVESFEASLSLLGQGVVGVTINAVMHPYWPASQELSTEQVRMDIENLVPEIISREESSQTEADKIKKEIEIRYGIVVEVVAEKRQLRKHLIQPLSEADLTEKLEQLKAQLEKIPPDFLRTLGLEKLALCGEIQGIDKENQRTNYDAFAMTDTGSHITYLQVMWPFYHELFHAMDAKHHGVASQNLFEIPLADAQNYDGWLFLDKEYKAIWDELLMLQGSSKESDTVKRKQLQEKLRELEVDPDEEQAEYSRILFNRDNLEVQDQYLKEMETESGRAKMAQMKKWLYDWSGGRFNEQFWDDIANGRVNEFYW